MRVWTSEATSGLTGPQLAPRTAPATAISGTAGRKASGIAATAVPTSAIWKMRTRPMRATSQP